MWANILETLGSYSIIDWTVLLTGLTYAFLSMLNKPACWIFGIISCGLLSYQDFTTYNLLFDGALQIFYVFMGILGLYRWIKRKTDEGKPYVISLPITSHLNALLLGTLLSVVLVFLIKFMFNPAFAFLDCLTTVFSIWATWLLVNRVYDVWYYWIIINALYIYIYISQGADLFAVLSVVYFISSVGGIFTWIKDLKKTKTYLENI